MMHQPSRGELAVGPPPSGQRLGQRTGHEIGGLAHRRPPPENPPGIDVGNERHVAEAAGRPHVGEIRDPHGIRPVSAPPSHVSPGQGAVVHVRRGWWSPCGAHRGARLEPRPSASAGRPGRGRVPARPGGRRATSCAPRTRTCCAGRCRQLRSPGTLPPILRVGSGRPATGSRFAGRSSCRVRTARHRSARPRNGADRRGYSRVLLESTVELRLREKCTRGLQNVIRPAQLGDLLA